jgi:hypothetical protein
MLLHGVVSLLCSGYVGLPLGGSLFIFTALQWFCCCLWLWFLTGFSVGLCLFLLRFSSGLLWLFLVLLVGFNFLFV